VEVISITLVLYFYKQKYTLLSHFSPSHFLGSHLRPKPRTILKKDGAVKAGVVVHTCNHSSQEVEARG
jgi:hypothetical protein